LERLAVLAERAGIRRFQATTLASNTQMLEVFRDSGFEIRSKLAGSAVEVELALASSVASVAAGEKRQRIATAASLRPLFEPQAVAVIGASRNPSNIGCRVLDFAGVETMMGIAHDALFGPLIAFGLGGIHVEILGDVRFRIAPLTDRDVDELVHEIKGFPLLQGYRGHAAADLDALREVLLRLSRLAADVPEIAELDLNPVIALPPGHGCRIVDARIRVR